ncbi:hypothetical protein TNCV_639261 [Trichonephila clavipes]|nr:hypothetical protein TNCV_639261 [Trichonephila clavipes]
MSNKPNVNEISKAHLDEKEQEVELQAVRTIVKICKISTPKENIDRILEEYSTSGRSVVVVVSGVFIKCSILEQVVAIHPGMAAERAGLVSSHAKLVDV